MKNAFSYVGTDYDKMDCYELVRVVLLESFGIKVPKLEEHSPTPKVVGGQALSDPHWVAVPYNDRQAGDVMALSPTVIKPTEGVGHVGIVLHKLWVLHADKKYGAIIQDEAGLRRRGFIHRAVYRWQP